MDDVEYVYTAGMDEEEIDRLLGDGGHGVLSLARDGDAYGIPLNYSYNGDRLFIRVSDENDSEKIEFARATNSASFVVYDVIDETNSWSIFVRGTLRQLTAEEQDQFTDSVLNKRFPPFRLFDETVERVEIMIYELIPDEIVGRKTLD